MRLGFSPTGPPNCPVRRRGHGSRDAATRPAGRPSTGAYAICLRARTNETLRRLLRSIGIDIAGPTAADAGGGTVFLTNAVLCLKNGGMQAKVSPDWFTNCGSRFLRPTIDLIAPRVGGDTRRVGLRGHHGGVRRAPHRVQEGRGWAGGFCRWLAVSAAFRCTTAGRGYSIRTGRWIEQLRDWERVGRAMGGVRGRCHYGADDALGTCDGTLSTTLLTSTNKHAQEQK